MNNSEMFYLACHCLTSDASPGFWQKASSAFQEEKLLEDLVFLCSNELVLPAIYLNFKKNGVLGVLPEELSEQLAYIYDLNKKRNTEILQQVTEINQILNTQQIEPVYLKGTANLLDGLYDDFGERMIGDIDVLVKEHDYLAAAELVMGLGYSYDQKVYDDITTMKHFPRLFRTGGAADIEIHSVPVNIEYSKQFSSDLLFQHK